MITIMKISRIKKLLILLVLIGIAACSDSGVPHVEDYRNIVVDGQPITHRAFLKKYCPEGIIDQTCDKVRKLSSTRGEMPSLMGLIEEDQAPSSSAKN